MSCHLLRPRRTDIFPVASRRRNGEEPPEFVAERLSIDLPVRVAGQWPFANIDVSWKHVNGQPFPARGKQCFGLKRITTAGRSDGYYRLAKARMRDTKRRHFAHQARGVKDLLDFHGAYAIARGLDHLVTSPDEIQKSIFVLPYSIPGKYRGLR